MSASSEVDGPHLLKQVTAPEIEGVNAQSPVKDTTTPDVKKLYREGVLKGMRTADVDKLWYKALDEEDCVAVMTLLKVYPGLLRIGWGFELSRDEGPREKDSGMGTPMTGATVVHMDAKREGKRRTALHVAARRGCVDLIKQVLDLCTFDVNNSFRVTNKNPKSREGKGEKVLAKNVLARSKRKESQNLGNAAVWRSRDHSDNVGHDALLIPSSPYEHPGYLGSLWDHGLRDLLHCVDSEYQLDAFHMTAVNGRLDHLAFLACARDEIDRKSRPYPVDDKARLTEDDKARLAQVRTATQDVMAGYSGLKSCLEGYESHLDFNFLPLEQHPEYLFHYSFTSLFNEKAVPDYHVRRRFRKELWDKICSLPDEVWRFLLHLQDGQGRPPIHVAIAEGLIIEFFRVIDVPEDENDQSISCAVSSAVTACDAAGRTPVYRASATGSSLALGFMTSSLRTASGKIPDEIAATFHSPYKFTMPLSHSEGMTGIGHDLRCIRKMYCCTPLHAAIIQRNFDCVRQLVKVMKKLCVDGKDVTYMGERTKIGRGDRKRLVKLDYMELALIVGDKAIVKLLLDNKYLAEPKEFDVHVTEGYVTALWPTLHIAAARGDFEMLKWFTDSPECGLNSFARRHRDLLDYEGNTPLHHTLQLTDFGFTFNWLDCVTFDQIRSNNCPRRPNIEVLDDKRIAEIQGCVNLLIQAGFDTFTLNDDKRDPHPRGGLSENVSFLSWWYQTQMADLAGVESKLSSTANAISVTATLIASASYFGPLQPPMGYDPSNQIQYKNGWVATFIFFDNLSFYGAILALSVSLVPYLQGLRQALVTQIAVKYATILMLYAMFSLVIAFASSSMAVVSDNMISTVGGKMTIVVTSSFGGCCALVVAFILWLSYRNASNLVAGLLLARIKANDF